MTTKHTAGPWNVYGDDKTLIGAKDGKMMLAKTNHRHICQEWSRTVEEAQANARLIAAAPELLAALEQLTEKTERANTIRHSGGRVTAGDWAELHQLTNEARAAIEKARGEG